TNLQHGPTFGGQVNRPVRSSAITNYKKKPQIQKYKKDAFVGFVGDILQSLVMAGQANVTLITAVASALNGKLPSWITQKSAVSVLAHVLQTQAMGGFLPVNLLVTILSKVNNGFFRPSGMDGLNLVTLEGIEAVNGDIEYLADLGSFWGKINDRIHKFRDKVLKPRVKNITNAASAAANEEVRKLKSDTKAVKDSAENPQFNLKVLYDNYPVPMILGGLWLGKKILFK
ncbi:MAG: hypothetical protein HN590_11015, partial [Calditrichaeota bacterium]|nr:hypothetical protein [Calditrichota bacterium]